MKVVILNAAEEVIETLEGTEAELLAKVPPGARMVIVDESVMAREAERAAAEAPLTNNPQAPDVIVPTPPVKVAIFNDAGKPINVLEGTLEALLPFTRDAAAFRVLNGTAYESEVLATKVPSLKALDAETAQT